MPGNSFLRELKRRHVYRVAVAYAVVGWLLIEIATQIFPVFHIPDWAAQLVVLLIAIGFPIAVVLAWVFEMTLDGVRRTEPVDSPEARAPDQAHRVGKHLNAIIIGVLALAVVVLLWQKFMPSSIAPLNAPAQSALATTSVKPATVDKPATEASADAIPAKSIAVLPFDNLSEDKDNQYFADGIQDLILTKLTDIGDLKVISRISTMKYASHPDDIKTIAQQLGVATILEGSVQKAGNRVLINVQLIDANTDSHIWAQSYQQTLDNIFGVEGDVATRIASALNAKLTPAAAAEVNKIATHNPAALDAFLKAKYYLSDSNRTGDEAELARAVPLFQIAIQQDPNYADAYAYLSLAYQKLGGHQQEAEDAARRALTLDPENANAHTEYAFALMNKGEFDAAIAQAGKAVALPSHDASSIDGLGVVLFAAGRFDESANAFERAIDADPTVNFSRVWLARVSAYLRRYADARKSLLYVTARDPNDVSAAVLLASVQRVGWGNLVAAHQALQATTTSITSSAALSDAWYALDFASRDYQAASSVIAAAPAAMFDDTSQALYEARIARAQGDASKAQSAFTSARDQLQTKVKAAPDHPWLYGNLAQALAGLGKGDAAIGEAKRAISLLLVDNRTAVEPGWLVNLASVYAHTGRAGDAIDVLTRLLSTPAGLDMSVSDLRINPEWDPLRKEPRFQALLKKYADPQQKEPANDQQS